MTAFFHRYAEATAFVAAFFINLSASAQKVVLVDSKVPAAVSQPGEMQVKPGPWGQLSYTPLVLEPPENHEMLDSDTGQSPTVWLFKAPDSSAVAGILDDAGLSSDLVTQLTGPEHLSRNEVLGLYQIEPPEDVIINLTSDQRRLLYRELEPKSSANPFYQPYALQPKYLTLVPSGVSRPQLDLIEKLSFKWGDTHRFSDINLVLRKAANDQERLRILKTIRRERSFSVKLKLSRDSNLSELANYWGSNGRNTEVFPILESVVRTSGVESLDIVHLLPPTPRKLLHTFPSLDGESIGEDFPDCFWTAHSFFSDSPPDRHLGYVGHVFSERYFKVAPQSAQFGDLIVIQDKGTGSALHVCNHIAGSLVFSKNGLSIERPWVISTLNDVAKSYLKTEAISISFYRLKPQFRR